MGCLCGGWQSFRCWGSQSSDDLQSRRVRRYRVLNNTLLNSLTIRDAWHWNQQQASVLDYHIGMCSSLWCSGGFGCLDDSFMSLSVSKSLSWGARVDWWMRKHRWKPGHLYLNDALPADCSNWVVILKVHFLETLFQMLHMWWVMNMIFKMCIDSIYLSLIFKF